MKKLPSFIFGIMGIFAILSVAVAQNNAATDSGKSLWKLGAKGWSSKHGNTFVVTATYVGLTVLTTNSRAVVEGKDESDADFDSLQAQLVLHTGYNRTNGTEFAAGYYRGTIVFGMIRSGKFPKNINQWNTNLVSIFSSADLTKLVLSVDNGPIYVSTNSGITWNVNNKPGKYAFALDETPDGTGMFAEILIKTNSTINVLPQIWYATTSAQNGSQLIVSEGESAPVLSINYSGGNATVTWAACFTGFFLQQNADLTTTNWTDVTIIPTITNGLNQVVISPALGNQFYRLKKGSQ